MRNIIYKSGVFLICTFIFSTCGVIQQAKTLSNCTFNFVDVNNFKIAGVSLNKDMDINQISIFDAAKILTALSSKNAKISFDVNVKGNNPNTKAASIDKMQYIILLDNQEMLYGELNEKFMIPAKGSNLISINANLDAMKILNENTIKNVYNLYQKITGNNTNNTSKISIKLKPTINRYTFPSYITLNKHL